MKDHLSRRRFVQSTGATVAGAALVPSAFGVMPRRRADTINVGLIGCGGRGTGAAHNALTADPDVRIVALADVFEDRLIGCRGHLEGMGDRGSVRDNACFVGFDAYRELLREDVDAVILATPPHFRPIHLAAAVDANKHVFMEKPVAVDPTGYRTVINAGAKATASGLGIVAGTQRRHEASYRAAMQQIHAGAIGEVVAARCYWNQGGLWMHQRKDDWCDMEWQLRNWLYFTWLSGDHIVEQHIHNIDVVNWAMGGPPVRALGVGGRQARTDSAYGHVFDHFAIEFEYPNGEHMLSMCRQMDGCTPRVEEVITGTRGRLTTRPGSAMIAGESPWHFADDNPNPYVQEHVDLYQSIRAEAPLNEAKTVAESTLTAIMGRLAAYTGQELTWDQMVDSELDLAPGTYAFGSLPTPDIAIPGQTPFI
ncbi:MAG: Gfo/Idh/MocA family oxidoreductase [Planctomycetota bacterium]